MKSTIITGLIALFCWTVFFIMLSRDRSRYRNCYMLFIALLSLFPFFYYLSGSYEFYYVVIVVDTLLISLLIVPFFLIFNGVSMIRREGRQLKHMLSLVLGLVILLGEAVFFVIVLSFSFVGERFTFEELIHSWPFIAGVLFSGTVIYGSMAFLIFMIYVLFLQIIPRRKEFDYVIIHGAGLLQGDRVSRLLQARLDKAIAVYRKDPTPTKLIPSGGQGADETVSEAEAMKRYLVEHGVPEDDILLEDRSKTTLENLTYSKQILDGREGKKCTALVTSNYHVYRALRYSKKIGLSCTGIGSRVAFYYWPSALIREFIAIHLEPKHAVMFFGGWLVCAAGVLYLLLS